MADTRLLITIRSDDLPPGSSGQVCQLIRGLLTVDPFRIVRSIRDRDLREGFLVDFGEEAMRDRFVATAYKLLNEAVMVGVDLEKRD